MPVITISRQEGSQGEALARLVAERLGFVVVDRDAMIAAAREQGVDINKAPVPEIDEKKPSFWERLDDERRRYNLLLRYLVYHYAERDKCIILGHGSEVFLAGLSHVLKVKVTASFDTRVKRLMERAHRCFSDRGFSFHHAISTLTALAASISSEKSRQIVICKNTSREREARLHRS